MSEDKKKDKKVKKESNTKENTNSSLIKTKKYTIRTVLGLVLLTISIILFFSFVSYFYGWFLYKNRINIFVDQSIIDQNSIGKLGNYLGDIFIFKGIGICAFLIPFLGFIFSLKILMGKEILKLWKTTSYCLVLCVLVPIALAMLFGGKQSLPGLMGIEIYNYLKVTIGVLGTLIMLIVSILIFLVLEFNLSYQGFKNRAKEGNLITDGKEAIEERKPFGEQQVYEKIIDPKLVIDEVNSNNPQNDIFARNMEHSGDFENNTDLEIEEIINEEQGEDNDDNVQLEIKKPITEEVGELSNNLVQSFGPYDPKLDLPNYKIPRLDLLKSYNEGENITVNNKELEDNKNKILSTLANYGIKIANIKATIGPTVTLYEIIPEAGVRISKIKNLEDDIALSLSALGIRIIAPIPGKGTIGIEVPNSNPTIVSMRSVIASQKFQKIEMELPIVFGKTISNETFVTDLAKMPHLLMAGATGQGKSVGLNTIITSLLYKKHPSELKFVFVDPKKVELTLFNKIERHFLAKLPDSEEAIITDNLKVINTLNSLCIEMDSRYELLKLAMVRNIKEYNKKFIDRKLNPEKGHKFLPYIVLIIDEFADLIMTAGKEVELPIARLAQLARAIGIHLIIATQRPSVNVITGMIKANFPARVGFRVTSKIDSRTILDSNGADQLIGKGDMLFTTGNELIRMQCAFVDTPEVDRITDFIGSQKGYSSAYLLPEYVGEENTGGNNVDAKELDELFGDAARVIVIAQQGSTSLIQRKLSLGYNRAGRIMDQLEATGIVGAFEGSKARKVLINDINTLEQMLLSLK